MRNLNREAATVWRRGMVVAHWVWIPVAVLAVGVLIASIPSSLQLLESDLPPGLSQDQLGTPALASIAFGRLVSFGTAVLSISLAGILYWQRADDMNHLELADG